MGMIWSAVAALGVAVAVFWFGFLKGTQHEADRHAELYREIAVAGERIRIEGERRLRLADEHAAAITAGYSAAVRDLDRDYASRLDRVRREFGSCSRALPAAPEPTGRIDGAPASDLPATVEQAPSEFEAACYAIERDAAADALTLAWLQEWARGQAALDRTD